MLSYHNGQVLPDIYSTKQAFVQRPIGEQEISCGRRHRAFPHRCGEYAERICFARWLSSRLGYHTPCLSTNAAANLRWSSAGQLQSLQLFLQAFWCHARWQLRQWRQAGRRLLQRVCCVLRLFWPCQWGSGRYGPPKTRLAHSRVGGLPLEIYTAKFGTAGNKSRPDFVEQSAAYPSLESAVNRTVVRKPFGQLVPLAASSHTKDYCIEYTSRVHTLASCMLRRIEFSDNWFYVVPQFIRHAPNCRQRLYLTFFSHLCILSMRLHRCYRSLYVF
jgi:hypothetical protein